MKLFVLFAQRTCTYDGEFLPEPMEVADEYTMGESPEWMEEKRNKLIVTGEYSAVKLIEVSLCRGAVAVIEKSLNGNPGVDASFVEVSK